MPFSPRWLVEVGRDEEARQTLAMLRIAPADSPYVRLEYLEIKGEVEIVKQVRAAKTAGKTTMMGRLVQPYVELVSTKANFHRLAIGCLVIFYQQFIGCNVSCFYGPVRKAI
jgi:DNA-directed RNA polymerase subunit H (RpoH/RPB5)